VSAPERIVEKVVTLYEVQRQCLAPDCGQWFVLVQDTQQWCSKRCRNRVSRIKMKKQQKED